MGLEYGKHKNMIPYRLKTVVGFISILILLFSPGISLAQEQEEDFEDYGSQQSVYWHVNIDVQGKASSNLTVITPKDKLDEKEMQAELTTALQEALKCTLENIRFSSAKHNIAINADCRIPVVKNDLVMQVLFKPSALRSRLEKRGSYKMNISLSVPKLGHSSTPMNTKSFSYGARTTYSLSIKPEEKAVSDLTLEFGYRRSYLIALVAATSVVLFAPIVLILVIRKRSLMLAGKDATAAWFGYWRVHRWIAEGIWIVWIITLSLFNVETFIGYLAGSDQPILNALVLILPPGIVSFLCQYLARPLWMEVRGVAWNRWEMLVKGFWEHAAAILPLAFIIIGINSLFQHGGKAMLWFAGALIVKLVGTWMHGKISKTMPRTIQGGELKEKILDMAHRAGVKIQQVFLMPSKQLQMGNAFAMQGQRVMITDYLLERLTKRETDCVMAHEIGHVKMRHTLFLSWVGILIFFVAFNAVLWGAFTIVPSFLPLLTKSDPERLFAVQNWLNEYLLFPFALLFVVLSRYFLSRRFERSADEFATLVTGDPEAMITALVKLSKMNLMPISWENWDERLATHPSTLRRAKAIAERHRIPGDRLRVLLETPASRGEGDGYTVPDEVTSTNLVYSTEFRTQKTLVITLLLMLTVSATPLIWVRFVSSAGFPAVAYWAGLVLMPLIFLAVANYASLLGYGKMKRGMREKAARSGIDPDNDQCYFVGLSPEPHPRIYENHTVWDIGFLNMTDEALAYFGDRVNFRIPRDRVTSITRGISFPGWFGVPETYIRWTEEGQERVLHFHSIDGRSMTAIAKRSKSLLLDLMNWKEGRLPGRPTTGTERALGLPVLPDVQGIHPRQAVTVKGFLSSLVFVAVLVFGISGFFALDNTMSWYGFGMGSWSLLFGSIPSMRFKEIH